MSQLGNYLSGCGINSSEGGLTSVWKFVRLVALCNILMFMLVSAPAKAAAPIGRYYKMMPGTSSYAFGLLYDPDYDVLIVAANRNNRVYSFDLAAAVGTAICGTGAGPQSTSPASPGTSFAIYWPVYCALLIQSDTGSIAHYVCSAQTSNVLVKIDRAAPHASDVLTGVADSGGFADSPSTVKFNRPYGLVTDRVNKRVYVVDQLNYRVREVNYTSGGAVTVSTLAGSGAQGGTDGSPATAATFNWPTFVHIVFGTTLFIAEIGAGCSRLRRLYPMSTAGTVSTIFGNGVTDSTYGYGIASMIPSGSSSGTLLFFRQGSGVEVFNFSSQSFVETGAVPWNSTALPTACAPQATTRLSDGTFLPNGSLVSARFAYGTTATDWDLFITLNVAPGSECWFGDVNASATTVAVPTTSTTTAPPTTSTTATAAPAAPIGRYYKILPGVSAFAYGLLHDPDYDVLVVAAADNGRVYSFDLATTVGTAICGTGATSQSSSPASPGTSFAIMFPIDCALLIQSDTGSIAHYVCSAQAGEVLVKIDRTAPHASDVLSGVADSGGFADSPSTVKFNWPYGLATDRVNKRVYVVDQLNYRVRQVVYTSGGAVTVSTLAGMGPQGGADGSPATSATFAWPTFVHIVFGTTLFMSEIGPSPNFSRLRRLYPMSTAGTVSTIFNPSNDVEDSTSGVGITSMIPSGSSSGTLLFFRQNSGVEVFNFSSQSFVETGAVPWTSTVLPTACAPQATNALRDGTFLPNGSLVSTSKVAGTGATAWDLFITLNVAPGSECWFGDVNASATTVAVPTTSTTTAPPTTSTTGAPPTTSTTTAPPTTSTTAAPSTTTSSTSVTISTGAAASSTRAPGASSTATNSDTATTTNTANTTSTTAAATAPPSAYLAGSLDFSYTWPAGNYIFVSLSGPKTSGNYLAMAIAAGPQMAGGKGVACKQPDAGNSTTVCAAITTHNNGVSVRPDAGLLVTAASTDATSAYVTVRLTASLMGASAAPLRTIFAVGVWNNGLTAPNRHGATSSDRGAAIITYAQGTGGNAAAESASSSAAAIGGGIGGGVLFIIIVIVVIVLWRRRSTARSVDSASFGAGIQAELLAEDRDAQSLNDMFNAHGAADIMGLPGSASDAAGAASPAQNNSPQQRPPGRSGYRAALEGTLPRVFEDSFSFTWRDAISSGTSGTVYRAVDPATQQPVAVKIFQVHVQQSKALQRELCSACFLQHPNLVSTTAIVVRRLNDADVLAAGVDETEREQPCGIMMELMGPTLQQAHGHAAATLEMRVRWLRQVALGLEFAHAKSIIHNDVKLENIMLSGALREGDDAHNEALVAKVGDLGSSSVMHTATASATSISGTPLYMCPSRSMGRAGTAATDSYSFGMTMWKLLHPPDAAHGLGDNQVAISVSVSAGRRPPIDAQRVPGPLCELMEACWHADAKQRPLFPEIVDRMFAAERELAGPQLRVPIAGGGAAAGADDAPFGEQIAPSPLWSAQWLDRPEIAAALASLVWQRDDGIVAYSEPIPASAGDSNVLMRFVCEQMRPLRAGAFAQYEITRVQMVHHDINNTIFFAQHISDINSLRLNAVLRADLPADDASQRVLQHLRGCYANPETPDPAHFVFCWHGCRHDLTSIICRDGPRALRLADPGFFGAASYTALELEYIEYYSTVNGPNPETGEFAAILFCASVSQTYPVTLENDYCTEEEEDQRNARLRGFSRFYASSSESSVALFPKVDSHVIPVKTYRRVHPRTGEPVPHRLDQQCCDVDDPGREGTELCCASHHRLTPVAVVYFRSGAQQ